MKQFKMIISAIILLASIIIFSINLLNTSPIQIILETGQEVTASAEYFSIEKTLMLSITAFLIGVSITYLFYNSDKDAFKILKKEEGNGNYDLIMPMLKDDEKKIVLLLKDNKGELLQNKIVQKLGISKVKTARIIFRLEKKCIVSKQRFGLTNKIMFIK